MKWESIKFSELYAIPSKNGLIKPSKVRGNGYKMINMGELFANDRIYDIPMELVPLNEKEKSGNKIEINDLLFARQSLVLEGAGKCCIVLDVSPLTVFESHIIRVRLNPDIAYPLFFYYYFRSPQSPTKSIVSQGVQAGIRASDLSELEVCYPPIETQRRIADILSAYDNLIENNQKQIKLLEEAAQRLYKEWFVDLRFPGYENTMVVDGVPEGWENSELSEIADLKAGGDKPKAFSETMKDNFNIPIYSNGIDKKGLYGYTDIATVEAESITISARGTVGFVCLRREPYTPIVRLISVIPKTEKVNVIYLYLYLFNQSFRSTGAAQQQITVPLLKNKNVLIPDKKVQNQFLDFSLPIFDKIDIIEDEINKLSEARDRLLPKLMSGEVEV